MSQYLAGGLLHTNLREAVERFLNHTQMQQQAQATKQLRQKRTSSELARREGSRQRCLTLYNQVVELHKQGGTISGIARQLRIGKQRGRRVYCGQEFSTMEQSTADQECH